MIWQPLRSYNDVQAAYTQLFAALTDGLGGAAIIAGAFSLYFTLSSGKSEPAKSALAPAPANFVSIRRGSSRMGTPSSICSISCCGPRRPCVRYPKPHRGRLNPRHCEGRLNCERAV